MDQLRRSDLHELLQSRAGPCLSMFLPTTRVGKETQQNQLRAKNGLEEAATQLEGAGMRTSAVRALLAPAHELLRDGMFWNRQADGLAMFLAADGYFRSFRLPVVVPEQVIVNERFHVRPLLPALWPDQPFHLLALSRHGVRLLRCSRFGVERVELRNVPHGIQDVLRFIDAEKQRQLHTAGPRGIVHGVRDEEEERIAEYLRAVARGVEETLRTQNMGGRREQELPLLLAGVEELRSVYRDHSAHPRPLERGVDGSPDRLSDQELHERAWPHVEPMAAAQVQRAVARYEEAAGRGHAPDELDEILMAGLQGRIDTLLLSNGKSHVCGRFDIHTGEVWRMDSCGPGCEDLLDRAAALTVLNDGVVYTLDQEHMPEERLLAAILRF